MRVVCRPGDEHAFILRPQHGTPGGPSITAELRAGGSAGSCSGVAPASESSEFSLAEWRPETAMPVGSLHPAPGSRVLALSGKSWSTGSLGGPGKPITVTLDADLDAPPGSLEAAPLPLRTNATSSVAARDPSVPTTATRTASLMGLNVYPRRSQQQVQPVSGGAPQTLDLSLVITCHSSHSGNMQGLVLLRCGAG